MNSLMHRKHVRLREECKHCGYIFSSHSVLMTHNKSCHANFIHNDGLEDCGHCDVTPVLEKCIKSLERRIHMHLDLNCKHYEDRILETIL